MMNTDVSNDLILYDVNPVGEEIGRGAYGRVFEVEYQGTSCAAKEVHELLLQYSQGEDRRKIVADFIHECQIWSTIRHPHIVQFLGVYYHSNDEYRLPVMVMEKMQHSLRSLVEKYAQIPLNVKLCILDEVCLGLRYLHSRNPPIVHRDLTPNNILLSSRLEAKITDLGVAKVMQTDNKMTMTKIPGTPGFMPPEALTKRPLYGPPLDIFSFGGVMLNAITQQWPEPTDREQLNTATGRWELVSEVIRRQNYINMFTGNARGLISLVTSCLNDNPVERPLVMQVSIDIKKAKDTCSQMTDRDGMSPIVWWAEVSGQYQQDANMLVNEGKMLQPPITPQSKPVVPAPLTSPPLPSITNKDTSMEQSNQHPETNLNDETVEIKWQEGAPSPVGSAVNILALHKGKIYMGGGNEDELKPSYRIDVYDPTKNLWSPSPIITPSYWFAMTTLNDRLVIAGGKSRCSEVTNEVFSLDDNRLILTEYTRMVTPKSNAAAAGYRGILILAGGKDNKGKVLASTELFDSVTRQWYTSDDLLVPHWGLQSVIVDNVLYLLGGINQNDASKSIFTAPLDTLLSHKLKWSHHKDFVWRRSSPISFEDRCLLLLGGWKERGDYTLYSAEVHMFSKVSQRWKVIGEMLSPRCGPATLGIPDHKIVVIGGVDLMGSYTNTVWIGSCESFYTYNVYAATY